MLSISQTYAKIGIQTQNAQMNITTTKPQINIKQQHPKVEIKTELPKVQIDQYECFAEAGLKGNLDLRIEATQLAKQQAMDYIAKVAMDGDELAAIENGGDPIVGISERDAYPEHEFNIDLIPKSRPKIDFTGSIDIQVKPGDIKYDVNLGKVKNNFIPAKVKIYLQQEPSVTIKYIGKNVDTRI